ncbi:zinc finger protein 2 homolog isoform X10 [Scomber scombrus]|uniref:Zinc finger protein 2 homolog isoform X10 n=1 Tax=Scomber scombrus TaxID=13677 RepID=A0AAV1MUV9_SCOSC
MSSVQHLREFMNERLTAAAEEIFRVFHKSIIEYEEEIDRQRRLLDIVWKPEIKLDIAELPQQHVCKEEEVLVDQQLCNQECNSSLDQEDPEPPQIKEEQEEHCTSVEGEQLVLKQETETFMSTAPCEESDNIKVETQDFSPDETQNAAETEHVVGMSIKSSVDSGSIRNVEPKLQRRHHRSKSDKLTQQQQQEEVLTDEQLCNHERNSSLDQEDPEPPQIKEEQEELCTNLERQQLVVKQETETFISTAASEESDSSEERTLDLMIENVVSLSVKSSEVPETNSDDQLLSHNSHVAESQDHKGGKLGVSGSTRNTETKPQKGHYETKSHSDNVCSPTTSKIQLDTETGKKVLKCDTCGKAFKFISHLKVHHRVHTGEKPYTCDTCGKRFSQVGVLKEHMIVHTGEKPYPCDTCGKRFSQIGKMKSHRRTHTGEKPFPCNTCGKRFSEKSILKQHMKVHTGEKPYGCHTCEKRFSHLSVLHRHMKIHTGEKPYPCDTCGKRFSEMTKMKRHMRVHTGEKPYSCHTCEKRFSRMDALRMHMRVHTGERPYPCNTCEKRFLM